jgi:putative hydrolase of the HAD superfamily
LAKINAVIFDLDNVLYDERDYVFAAYREIAAFLSKRYGLSDKMIYRKLVHDLRKKSSMYPRLFNDLLDDLGLDPSLLRDLLLIYANVAPPLCLFLEAESVLQTLRKRGIKLALVTNGGIGIQRNKIRLLHLEKYFDAVIYARDMGEGNEKPYPEAYRVALQELGVKPEETLCVGDNPYTDFWGAKKLGIRSIRVCRGEFRNVRLGEEYEADSKVHTLREICELFK